MDMMAINFPVFTPAPYNPAPKCSQIKLLKCQSLASNGLFKALLWLLNSLTSSRRFLSSVWEFWSTRYMLFGLDLGGTTYSLRVKLFLFTFGTLEY